MITVIHTAFNDRFKPVATVDTDSLDVAYTLTNNIEDSWTKNDGVEPLAVNDMAGRGFRSTSVGDVMVKDGKVFQVANFGFDEVTEDTIKILVVKDNDWAEDEVRTQSFLNAHEMAVSLS